MKVELSIGRLVLEGVPRHRAAALRRALESELGALLAAAPPGGHGDLHLRRATAAPVHATDDPTALGRRIAHTVHEALDPPRRLREAAR
ncbi:hypothetical protein [Streptomyces hiroshimensis]|uniref:Uncharacterized protein n=1 Tax=Streptomyces hiroshimensis TaxID=66424 RepID=A0ABQ2ZB99_9ACTN|nr:hypothetical protein [Streptomyces hiroshimensis]GGY07221.1 hypothetical protein GCM10010324_62620 [Streptomyces hiroshimensis]